MNKRLIGSVIATPVEIERIAGRNGLSQRPWQRRPEASSLLIIPGIATSDDEVAITISNSSLRRRMMSNKRTPNRRQISPKTISIINAMVNHAVATNIPECVERVHAKSAKGEGERAERTNWREFDDNVDDTEHQIAASAESVADRNASVTEFDEGATRPKAR